MAVSLVVGLLLVGSDLFTWKSVAGFVGYCVAY